MNGINPFSKIIESNAILEQERLLFFSSCEKEFQMALNNYKENAIESEKALMDLKKTNRRKNSFENLQKITSVVTGATSISMGYYTIQTGAILLTVGFLPSGALLVLSGSALTLCGGLAIGNEIFSMLDGWEKLAPLLTDDKEKQEKIANYGSSILNLTTSMVTFAASLFLSLPPDSVLSNITKILQKGASLASGVCAVGVAKSKKDEYSSKSVLEETKNNNFCHNQNMKDIENTMGNIATSQEAFHKIVATMTTMYSNVSTPV